ncbi:hypothetical protein F7731_23770 [Cytobacillus depressus]|uniref:Uncharacterized protein n=1 Tax=Cytobacillus depressus TaxID=1602942 RepID=A0A6L3V0K5_9BACI|nr:hypothetical protein [Cytobacillus depressus]KAB2328971.1 hypothetical protein F7731_23770 [Cytobacillus depressus]
MPDTYIKLNNNDVYFLTCDDNGVLMEFHTLSHDPPSKEFLRNLSSDLLKYADQIKDDRLPSIREVALSGHPWNLSKYKNVSFKVVKFSKEGMRHFINPYTRDGLFKIPDNNAFASRRRI